MRIIAIVIGIILVLLASCILVNAENADEIEIVLSADDANVNRLFDVSVASDRIDEIAGGEFTLCYDSSVLDFKKVSSESFDVKSKTYDDAVKIVFVIDDEMHSDGNLFDVQFKAKSKAVTDIKLVSSYVVNRKLDTVSTFGTCEVAVNKKESQKDELAENEKKTSTTSYVTATADNQSIKIDGYKNRSIGMYITAGIAIVIAISVNIWFMLRKKMSK